MTLEDLNHPTGDTAYNETPTMAVPQRTPVRVQRLRTKGSKMPFGAKYVGRPTIWGNPFKAGQELHHPYTVFGTHVRDTTHAVEIFRWYAEITVWVQALIGDLEGLDLACWCPLTDKDNHPAPCHADVLLEMANPSR